MEYGIDIAALDIATQIHNDHFVGDFGHDAEIVGDETAPTCRLSSLQVA